MSLPIHSQSLDQFLAVYRHRSLGKACRELQVSQPALSKSIRRTELALGVALFERRSVGMVPTAYADALALRAKVVQAELRKAASDMAHMRSHLTGEARIGVGPAIAAYALPRVMADLLGVHPDLSVEVREGLYESLAEWVISSELDLAITTMPFIGVQRGLVTEVLFRDRFVVAAGSKHPLVRQRAKVTARHLLAHPWVLPPREGVLWQRVVDLFVRRGLRPPEAQVITNSGECIKGLLLTERFLSFVPQRLVAHEEAQGNIVVLPVNGFYVEREVILLTRAGSIMSPASEAIVAGFKRNL